MVRLLVILSILLGIPLWLDGLTTGYDLLFTNRRETGLLAPVLYSQYSMLFIPALLLVDIGLVIGIFLLMNILVKISRTIKWGLITYLPLLLVTWITHIQAVIINVT